jgi:hypothetical protein
MSGVLYYRYHVEHEISDLFSVELAIPHKRSSRKSERFCCEKEEMRFQSWKNSPSHDGEKETNEANESLCNGRPFILCSLLCLLLQFPLQRCDWAWAILRLTRRARPDFGISGSEPRMNLFVMVATVHLMQLCLLLQFPLQRCDWAWAVLRLTRRARPDFGISGSEPRKTIVQEIQ